MVVLFPTIYNATPPQRLPGGPKNGCSREVRLVETRLLCGIHLGFVRHSLGFSFVHSFRPFVASNLVSLAYRQLILSLNRKTRSFMCTTE